MCLFILHNRVTFPRWVRLSGSYESLQIGNLATLRLHVIVNRGQITSAVYQVYGYLGSGHIALLTEKFDLSLLYNDTYDGR